MSSAIERVYALDYVRTFLVLIVIANHVGNAFLLSQFPQISFNNLDDLPFQYFPAFDGLFGYFHIMETLNFFAMPGLFFISGLFVWKSLTGKGVRTYLKKRFIRLIIPFFLGAFIVMPLVLLIVQYMHNPELQLIAYLKNEFTRTHMSVGVFWFLMLLYIFDMISALAYSFARTAIEKLQHHVQSILHKPFLAFILFQSLVFVMVYIPLQLFGHDYIQFGPIKFKESSLVAYFFFFSLGVLVTSNGILHKTRLWVQRWPFWILLSLLSFVVTYQITHLPYVSMEALPTFAGVLACTSMLVTVLTVSIRFCTQRSPFLSQMSTHSYAMFFTHQIVFALLPFLFTPFIFLSFTANALILIVISYVITYVLAIGLRKIPVIGTEIF